MVAEGYLSGSVLRLVAENPRKDAHRLIKCGVDIVIPYEGWVELVFVTGKKPSRQPAGGGAGSARRDDDTTRFTRHDLLHV